MTDQIPSAPGSPEPTTPARHSAPRQDGDATVPNAGYADPWAATRQIPPHHANPSAPAGSPWAPTQADLAAPQYSPTAQYPAGPSYATPYGTDATGNPPPAGYDGAASYLQFGPEDAAPKPARKRRRAIVFSSLVVVFLLIGVGAYAGVRVWTGSGTAEPETAMPATVGAFARIDVNPGVGQKLAADNLVKKFPTNGASTTELIAKLEAKISKAAGLNYDTDVKPWFGGQAGVAEWTDGHGKPVALIALASKDDTKARATLTNLRQRKGADSFGFAMEKGYALIAGSDGDMQAQATAAAAAAANASLADSATFKDAMSHVGDGNLLVAYADLGKLSSLMTDAANSALGGDPGMFGGLGGLGLGLGGSGGSGANSVTGRLAVGGKVTDDGIEVRAHVQGASGDVGTSTKVMSTIEGMPAATIAGASLSGLDPNSTAAKSLSGVLDSLGRGIGSGGGDLGGGSGDDPFAGFLSGGLQQLLTSKELSVAFTGLGSDDMPNLLIHVQARDDATATSLANSIDELTGGTGIPGLRVSHNGTSINATIGSPDTSGKLGSSDLFKETMAGMSDANSALYVDVQKIVGLAGGDMTPSDRAQVAPLKSIGFAAMTSGSSQDVLLRVVIK